MSSKRPIEDASYDLIGSKRCNAMRCDTPNNEFMEQLKLPSVTVIIALYNAQAFLVECLDSILGQTYQGRIEISVHNDASTDESASVLQAWVERTSSLRAAREPFPVAVVSGASETNAGAGACRNLAVKASSGSVLVIQDADDVMLSRRIERQVEALLREEGDIKEQEQTRRQKKQEDGDRGSFDCVLATAATTATTLSSSLPPLPSPPAVSPSFPTPNSPALSSFPPVLVGCNFERLPRDATAHYTDWANSLTKPQLFSQRFRECTLVHPTWCLRRSTLDNAGGYPEVLAEDLVLFLNLTGGRRQGCAHEDSSSGIGSGSRNDASSSSIQGNGGGCIVNVPTPSRCRLVKVGGPPLLVYRHHGIAAPNATATHASNNGGAGVATATMAAAAAPAPANLVSKTPRQHLHRVRLRAFEEQVLREWCHPKQVPSQQEHDDDDGSTSTSGSTSGSRSSSGGISACGTGHNSGSGSGGESSGSGVRSEEVGKKFVIWGAGRDGRAFLNGLLSEFRDKVACFVDVDERKVGKPYVNGAIKGCTPVDVLHWRDAPRGLPLVLCVAMGRTQGVFEANVAQLARERGLKDTVHYWHFN